MAWVPPGCTTTHEPAIHITGALPRLVKPLYDAAHTRLTDSNTHLGLAGGVDYEAPPEMWAGANKAGQGRKAFFSWLFGPQNLVPASNTDLCGLLYPDLCAAKFSCGVHSP